MSGCFNSCVRVAVSSPRVATRATCSSCARFCWSSSRSCAADASACLRAVTSIETPKSFRPVPSSGSTQRAAPVNPADHAVRLQHAILHFVFAPRLQRSFDRAVRVRRDPRGARDPWLPRN